MRSLRFSELALHETTNQRDGRDAFVIEGQIECRGGMGQRSDADPVDAGLGQGPHGKEIHTAGGLELDLRRGGITPADGLGDVLRAQVVDQDDIGRAPRARGRAARANRLRSRWSCRAEWLFARRRSRSRTDQGRPGRRLP